MQEQILKILASAKTGMTDKEVYVKGKWRNQSLVRMELKNMTERGEVIEADGKYFHPDFAESSGEKPAIKDCCAANTPANAKDANAEAIKALEATQEILGGIVLKATVPDMARSAVRKVSELSSEIADLHTKIGLTENKALQATQQVEALEERNQNLANERDALQAEVRELLARLSAQPKQAANDSPSITLNDRHVTGYLVFDKGVGRKFAKQDTAEKTAASITRQRGLTTTIYAIAPVSATRKGIEIIPVKEAA